MDVCNCFRCNLNMQMKELPLYLRISIEEYLEHKDDRYHWDMYWDDLYGSINSAQHDGVISLSEADDLRKKYLYGD